MLAQSAFYARSINMIVGGLPRAEMHSRYYLQSKDTLSVVRPWLPRRGAVQGGWAGHRRRCEQN
jgi:hypothetical protein